MKRKIISIALIFILLLTFALTACAPTETKTPQTDSTKQNPESTEAPEETKINDTSVVPALMALIQSGTVSYDFERVMESPEDGIITSTGTVAIRDGKLAITTEMVSEEHTFKSHIVVTNDKTYVIDHDSRIITSIAGTSSEFTEGFITEYADDLEPINSGYEEFAGKEMFFEEYEIEGTASKYYVSDGKVFAVTADYERTKSTMFFKNYSSAVSEGIFVLPENYIRI